MVDVRHKTFDYSYCAQENLVAVKNVQVRMCTMCIPCVYHVCTSCVPCVYLMCTMCVPCIPCVYHVCTSCVPCVYHVCLVFTLCVHIFIHAHMHCIPILQLLLVSLEPVCSLHRSTIQTYRTISLLSTVGGMPHRNGYKRYILMILKMSDFYFEICVYRN